MYVACSCYIANNKKETKLELRLLFKLTNKQPNTIYTYLVQAISFQGYIGLSSQSQQPKHVYRLREVARFGRNEPRLYYDAS